MEVQSPELEARLLLHNLYPGRDERFQQPEEDERLAEAKLLCLPKLEVVEYCEKRDDY